VTWKISYTDYEKQTQLNSPDTVWQTIARSTLLCGWCPGACWEPG